jgi:hypothetical protein
VRVKRTGNEPVLPGAGTPANRLEALEFDNVDIGSYYPFGPER